MKTVHFATRNKGKINSTRSILTPLGIKVIPASLNIPEPRTDDIRLIALTKVKNAFEQIRKPVIAQDSGFYIHALRGFPRTYVNFALDTIGIEGILKLVEGRSRQCEFSTHLAYCDEEYPELATFHSSITGTLAEQPRGHISQSAWSPLWLIFIPTGRTKTLSEMSPRELNEHRATVHQNSYLSQFAHWYLNRP